MGIKIRDRINLINLKGFKIIRWIKYAEIIINIGKWKEN